MIIAVHTYGPIKRCSLSNLTRYLTLSASAFWRIRILFSFLWENMMTSATKAGRLLGRRQSWRLWSTWWTLPFTLSSSYAVLANTKQVCTVPTRTLNSWRLCAPTIRDTINRPIDTLLIDHTHRRPSGEVDHLAIQ